jgi:hypothetical protein
MRSTPVLCGFAAWLATDGASAGARCTAGEVPVFSCATTSGKVVSLCASPDLSETAGSLRYRFGRPGRVELAHPQDKTPPQAAFRAGIIGASGGTSSGSREVTSPTPSSMPAVPAAADTPASPSTGGRSKSRSSAARGRRTRPSARTASHRSTGPSSQVSYTASTDGRRRRGCRAAMPSGPIALRVEKPEGLAAA